jgi:hypothetical protein
VIYDVPAGPARAAAVCGGPTTRTRWVNEYTIEVRGDTYRVELNGRQTTRFTNADPGAALRCSDSQSGYVGPQSHTGHVAFRDDPSAALRAKPPDGPNAPKGDAASTGRLITQRPPSSSSAGCTSHHGRSRPGGAPTSRPRPAGTQAGARALPFLPRRHDVCATDARSPAREAPGSPGILSTRAASRATARLAVSCRPSSAATGLLTGAQPAEPSTAIGGAALPCPGTTRSDGPGAVLADPTSRLPGCPKCRAERRSASMDPRAKLGPRDHRAKRGRLRGRRPAVTAAPRLPRRRCRGTDAVPAREWRRTTSLVDDSISCWRV